MEIRRLKEWARRLTRDAVAVSIAGRDPRVPWYVKVAALAVAAYALSPIDLVPDFIPIVGYLDDLVILPIALSLVIKMIPSHLMAEFRQEAQVRAGAPRSLAGAVLVVLVWALALVFALWAFWPTPANQ